LRLSKFKVLPESVSVEIMHKIANLHKLLVINL
jgi:hypothetical protein